MTDRSNSLSAAAVSGTSLYQLLGLVAPESKPLHVEWADIYDGVRGSGDRCPLALVIKRAYGDELEYINLQGERPVVKLRGFKEKELKLPPQMIEWIGKFDRGEEVGLLGHPTDDGDDTGWMMNLEAGCEPEDD